MSETHPIACACGTVRGTLDSPAWVNHAVCYCESCQAFPARLGKADEVLDARGGTDILQTSPSHVTLTQGREQLACLRITPGGPYRWYAACCNTPIGNTPANPKLSFVGLLHSCLGGPETLEQAFGPPRMRFFTKEALGEPKPEGRIPVGGMLRFAGRLLRARVSGEWRQTPFFDENGEPVARPTDPTTMEHDV